LPTLAAVDLRRAVLQRQLLTARAADDVAGVLSRVASLQSQYAPTMYVGLWSRVEGFRRDDLTTALGERRVVQGTMMRSTIHLTAAADYWPLNLAIRESRQRWYLRTHGVDETAACAAAARTRAAFDGADVLSRRELEAVAGPAGAAVGLFVDLVRVPPSGTWERRRADLFGLAEQWVGAAPDITAADAWAHAVRHYLTGFGPATVNEIASWAGVNVGAVTPAVRSMSLDRYRATDGKVLLDLPGLAVPPATTPLPVRFIGNWEALLLVHARRAEILAEADRPRIFGVRTPHSFSTFLVDGVVTGTWRHEDGRIVVEPWRALSVSERAAVDEEAIRLAALHT
ncbi:MAG TPA: winged helix DNA-binding domain-containing protein, partial [Ilumatobacteraceae bacterium]|nr:winged helix DNA-binding domain-containing protein [Ilumatobacteraceae bacterium]